MMHDNEGSAPNMNHVSGSPVKYEISEDDFLQLYYSEPRLAVLMDMDVIRLIDRHLVVNLKEFITPKTQHLTAKAKRNLSACCIGIQYVAPKKRNGNRKTIACTLDILIKSASFLEDEDPEDGEQSPEEQKRESLKIGNEIARVNDIINNLPGSFSESLKKLMKMKGYTEEMLAETSWVSLSTIKQYRQDEEKKKTLKTVTALCVGMHLHPWITENLLMKAGTPPRNTSQDGAYRFIYTSLYKGTIEDCNVYLRSQGLKEFIRSDRAS